MEYSRSAGILLHPTSLPASGDVDYGIGDLGPAAYEWIDFLATANQTLWQTLPLGPAGYGNSPYQCFSAFAGNTLLISPALCIRQGLIGRSLSDSVPEFSSVRVEYERVAAWKGQLLYDAAVRLGQITSLLPIDEMHRFEDENRWWLEDYALFQALKKEAGGKPWYEWDEKIRQRDAGAIAAASKRLANEIRAEKILQFLFFFQWQKLKSYANSRQIRIIGDIPIFVSADSADVWCNQRAFKLGHDGRPRVVAGVPPDFFSRTGQRWGNPVYDWEFMQQDGFRWWIARVEFALRMFDIVRIDHFRGFAAAWEVPAEEETAENGRWVEAPGRELFTALKSALGNLPFIVEDLGYITPEVTELRDEFGFPGMRILQFGFGGGAESTHLPHNYVRHCAAYTGTHDNDTAAGWWTSLGGNGQAESTERIFCSKYLNTNGAEIHRDFIRAVWSSVANLAMAPLQDVLGVGSEGRMNLPSTTGGNWAWRFSRDSINEGVADWLAEITRIYGRNRLRS